VLRRLLLDSHLEDDDDFLYGPLILLRAFSSLAALSNNIDSALLLSEAVEVYCNLPCTFIA
ncbi:MAG: hypothetical protein WB053_04250, partial [Nitrososphaeraceae archaeon]